MDLSILATDPIDYDAYVAAIRQEYGHVNDDDWRKGRGHFLRTMLERSRIFVTDEIRTRRMGLGVGMTYEEIARLNMNRELRVLE